MATDSYGNTGTAIRTVNVSDLDGPTITLNGDNPLTLELGSNYVELGAVVTDNQDTNLSAVITGSVNTNLPGTYTKTYTATDSSNNVAVVTRTIIVENNQNPVITLLGSNPYDLSLGLNYIEPGIST